MRMSQSKEQFLKSSQRTKQATKKQAALSSTNRRLLRAPMLPSSDIEETDIS
jgi:hypothetical protein